MSHATLNNEKALPEESLSQDLIRILDFKDQEVHAQLLDNINHGQNGPNNWAGTNTPVANNPDQHLISSFYTNLNKIKEQETKVQNSGANPLILRAEPSNLSNMAVNKLRLKL